jgi:hypothetical protein
MRTAVVANAEDLLHGGAVNDDERAFSPGS